MRDERRRGWCVFLMLGYYQAIRLDLEFVIGRRSRSKE